MLPRPKWLRCRGLGGISLEFPLGNSEALQNFIVGEVIYDSKSSKFTNTNGAQANTPTKENGSIYNSSGVTTALNANLSYLEVNLAYKYISHQDPAQLVPASWLVQRLESKWRQHSTRP